MPNITLNVGGPNAQNVAYVQLRQNGNIMYRWGGVNPIAPIGGQQQVANGNYEVLIHINNVDLPAQNTIDIDNNSHSIDVNVGAHIVAFVH